MVTQQKIREKTNKGLGEKSFFFLWKDESTCREQALYIFKFELLQRKKTEEEKIFLSRLSLHYLSFSIEPNRRRGHKHGN